MFHLPTSECTVTMEDVHMLLDLHVNGLAVIGRTNIAYETTLELLWIPLEESGRKGQGIKMKWLKDHYNALNLDEDSANKVKL